MNDVHNYKSLLYVQVDSTMPDKSVVLRTFIMTIAVVLMRKLREFSSYLNNDWQIDNFDRLTACMVGILAVFVCLALCITFVPFNLATVMGVTLFCVVPTIVGVIAGLCTFFAQAIVDWVCSDMHSPAGGIHTGVHPITDPQICSTQQLALERKTENAAKQEGLAALQRHFSLKTSPGSGAGEAELVAYSAIKQRYVSNGFTIVPDPIEDVSTVMPDPTEAGHIHNPVIADLAIRRVYRSKIDDLVRGCVALYSTPIKKTADIEENAAAAYHRGR